ncbi:MAG: regulatory protein RecX [Candidatus Binatia bacterium]
MRGGSTEEALKRAIKYLGYRARSEEEVRVKLTQLDFPEKSIKATLERLRLLKVLNDEDFARGLALTRAKGREYGPLRIERDLRQKGISTSLIRSILEEAFADQGEMEGAKRLLEKKFSGKDMSDKKVIRRAAALLQRFGYHHTVIEELLGQSLRAD